MIRNIDKMDRFYCKKLGHVIKNCDTRIVAKATLRNQIKILNNHNLYVVMLGLVRFQLLSWVCEDWGYITIVVIDL
jgi:hypothetical protein